MLCSDGNRCPKSESLSGIGLRWHGTLAVSNVLLLSLQHLKMYIEIIVRERRSLFRNLGSETLGACRVSDVCQGCWRSQCLPTGDNSMYLLHWMWKPVLIGRYSSRESCGKACTWWEWLYMLKYTLKFWNEDSVCYKIIFGRGTVMTIEQLNEEFCVTQKPVFVPL